MNILFLGASKRVSLLERFTDAARRLDVQVTLFSCEAIEGFYPISAYAQVLQGPSFRSDNFLAWLSDTVDKNKIDIVIPLMDSATVSLSKFSEQYTGECWPVVSSHELCKKVEDKLSAEAFFRSIGLPVVENTPGRFPKILKPTHGFGSKGIMLAASEDDVQRVVSKAENSYIVQDYIDMKETTVDLFISPTHGLVGYVLRDRLEVSDGEVMVCDTRNPDNEEKNIINKIASVKGWQGCITVQYFRDSSGHLYINEINPRFGGGATCSIEAGLDMAYYILSEKLKKYFAYPAKMRNIRMTRARRDFFCDIKQDISYEKK